MAPSGAVVSTSEVLMRRARRKRRAFSGMIALNQKPVIAAKIKPAARCGRLLRHLRRADASKRQTMVPLTARTKLWLLDADLWVRLL